MTDSTEGTGRQSGEGDVVDEMGSFAIVPTWVYQSVSSTAVVVYCALGSFANADGSSCFPSKAKIAERAGVSGETVKRALRELEAAGAIDRRPRFIDGRQTSNDYLLRRVERVSAGGSNGYPPGGAPDDPAYLDPEVPTQDIVPPVSPPRMSVDRKPVDSLEMANAERILAYWNGVTAQTLTAKTWMSKIIMRTREHPDLTVDDHCAIIRVALDEQHKWWKGHATPSVVYGSDAQFERCMMQARSPVQSPAERAYDIAAAAAEEARRNL